MNKTDIEWAEFTWNPVSGCAKVSDGCKHCYAETVANRFWGDRKFTDGQIHEDRLDAPLKRRKPARIFVNSMSDLFHEDVPFEFIDKVFAVMALASQHTFMILTKRPERMRAYASVATLETLAKAVPVGQWPITKQNAGYQILGNKKLNRASRLWPLPNVIGMVSVEDQPTADDRIPKLLACSFAVRGVSYEPALGPVDFKPEWFDPQNEGQWLNVAECGHGLINWVIAGGESGAKARPSHPDWFRSVRDQCKAAGVPFFFKQWGEWGPGWEFVRAATVDRETGETKYPGLFGDKKDVMFKKGKKKACHLLDGVEHHEFPQSQNQLNASSK